MVELSAPKAKPFLKWAGGKAQLIPYIEKRLPPDFAHRSNLTIIEPFIGSGAVLFWLLKQFSNIKTAIINDINSDLVNAYITVKQHPALLIKELKNIESDYYHCYNDDVRKEMFLKLRSVFNKRDTNNHLVKNTALLIFLNKTCFNGLYRVNSKNQFNVPFGRYVNPKICDEDTIWSASELLQKVTIVQGDYSQTAALAEPNSFFYFDPPYRPISNTASFNAYAKDGFGDDEQQRLAKFCTEIDNLGHQWLLSNSDPQNIVGNDYFFDNLYKNFKIVRVPARRSINSNASKRGAINELLITNY